jgi:outer membrane protein OmpA-like peptidoglycan-associated protein
MNRICSVTILLPLVAMATACAGERQPPRDLVEARADYVRARDGIAMNLDPTDVHEADLALQRAERAWRDAPDDPSTVDLAMVADRRALLALAEAHAADASQQAAQANARLDATRAAQLRTARSRLSNAQEALGRTQMQLQQEQVTSAEQQRKLRAMEASLAEARATIARIAAVREDDRGMVITLPGEVLFKTGKFDLKPAAMAKLAEIAGALAGKEQRMVVYGHTDDVGTHANNMALSWNRARSVRDYLVSQGIPQDLVTAEGKGPDEPVADNASVEGRAQNRRVEIVVQPRK